MLKRWLIVAGGLAVLSACAGKTVALQGANGDAPVGLTLTAEAFAPGQAIPIKYTCHGQDISPPLAWSGAPAGTQSLALVMDDPDAPMGTWVHWVVYNIPADAAGVSEGASQAKAVAFNLPAGAQQGMTSFRRAEYGGPCPPSGVHRYVFHLYALDTILAQQGMDKAALLEAMQGHVLAQGELTGVFGK